MVIKINYKLLLHINITIGRWWKQGAPGARAPSAIETLVLPPPQPSHNYESIAYFVLPLAILTFNPHPYRQHLLTHFISSTDLHAIYTSL